VYYLSSSASNEWQEDLDTEGKNQHSYPHQAPEKGLLPADTDAYIEEKNTEPVQRMKDDAGQEKKLEC
jgi:hypothetical protein